MPDRRRRPGSSPADWGWPAVGVDEAGRGPLAGPVVAAAVLLPRRIRISGLDDSKRVPAARRALLAEEIRARAIAWGVALATPAEIDAHNILQATFLAMRRALADLVARAPEAPAVVLVDGNKTIPGIHAPQRAIVGGDGIVASIAAASILAKVHRDALLDELHEAHPGYGFDRHKGYPTPDHLAALDRLGPCPAHRLSFGPVAQLALGL